MDTAKINEEYNKYTFILFKYPVNSLMHEFLSQVEKKEFLSVCLSSKILYNYARNKFRSFLNLTSQIFYRDLCGSTCTIDIRLHETVGKFMQLVIKKKYYPDPEEIILGLAFRAKRLQLDKTLEQYGVCPFDTIHQVKRLWAD